MSKHYKVEASTGNRKTNVSNKPTRRGKSPAESTEEEFGTRRVQISESRSKSRSPSSSSRRHVTIANKGHYSTAPQELFHDDEHGPHRKEDRDRDRDRDRDKDIDNPVSSDSKSESGASSASNQSSDVGFCNRHMQFFKMIQFRQLCSHSQENLPLSNEEDQRRFFCLVMSGKCGQLFFIAIAVIIPTYASQLRNFLYMNHNYWVFLPFGIAFVIGTIIRVFTFSRKLPPQVHAVFLLIVTFCYAYVMSSLSVRYRSKIVEKVFFLLTATCIFLTVFVITVNISVVKKMLYISATSSVIFFATAMALLPPVFQADPSFELSLDIWLPAVIASEILIYLLIFEVQSLLVGDRVPLKQKDWVYLALYL